MFLKFDFSVVMFGYYVVFLKNFEDGCLFCVDGLDVKEIVFDFM